jgi:hypothetical protein
LGFLPQLRGFGFAILEAFLCFLHQRVQPHILTAAHNQMTKAGQLVRFDDDGGSWYHLGGRYLKVQTQQASKIPNSDIAPTLEIIRSTLGGA